MNLRPRITPLILSAVVLVCLQTSYSQSPIQPGEVAEKITLQSHLDESYALFLPGGYKPEQSWPTIFCLDPRARGKTALERFVPAAKKYGYIVICSNNSRNGLNWTSISQIFSDLWEDTHSRFNIDPKRTYAAGFSGGSRLASTFASRCRGCLAGVIGCGAGFPGDIAPDAKTPFAYFGIAGVDDFNFGEMWQLEKKLSQLPAPYQFLTFDGGHEWPPQERIEQAMAWLTLQAMKSGATPKDASFLDEQFAARMAFAEQALKAQQYFAAQKAFASIVRDFQGLRDVTSPIAKLESLNKSDETKKESKAEEELYARQLREAGEIRMLWLKAPDPEDSTPSRLSAMSRLEDLKRKKEQPNDSKDRRFARRTLSDLLIGAYEAGQAGVRNNDYVTALTNYQLAKAIDPKNANTSYEIARMYALKKEKKSALQSLEEAVSLGFKDVARVRAEDAFSSVANEPRFQKILTAMTSQ
jgi:tetratricopeptide (TPR) repeat protein